MNTGGPRILNNNNNNNENEAVNNAGYEYSNNEWQPNENNNNVNKKPKKTNAEKTIIDFIQEGNKAKVREFLGIGKFDPDDGLVNLATEVALDKEGEDSLVILRDLIQRGLDPNENNPRNKKETPLNLVAKDLRKHAGKVFELLVSSGGNINGAQGTLPPIFTAIETKNTDIFNRIVKDIHFNIERTDLQGRPPVYMAVRLEWPSALENLLQLKPKLNYIDLISDSILISAVKLRPSKEKTEILSLLLADPRIKLDFHNKSNKDALMVAATMGDIESVKLLLNDRRSRGLLEKDYGSGNVASMVFSEVYFLKKQIKKGGDGKNVATLDEKRKLFWSIFEILIKAGANMKNIRVDGNTPLMLAIADHDTEDLKHYINKDITVRDLLEKNTETGETALTFATRLGYLDILQELKKLLLAKDWQNIVNEKDDTGNTPLQKALISCHADILLFLLENGASLEEDKNLIVEAIQLGETEEGIIPILYMLVDTLHMDMNEADSVGLTPLMVASKKGLEEVAKYLIESGVDVEKGLKAGDPLSPNAYDMAKSMQMRLLLAPYMEKDQKLFRGFLEQDFFRLQTMFSTELSTEMDPVSFVICPFCFLPLSKSAGCMYVFEHNCLNTSYTEKQIVHEKLYHTYKDEKSNISVCHHCNRAGFSFYYLSREGHPLVHHKHIVLNSPNPFIKPKEEKRTFAADYYDRMGCGNEGGGSLPEKITRIQTLLNFMCFLNEHFVGKIANLRAHLLCREMYWEAPLYDYLGKVPFSTEFADPKIKDVVDEYKGKTNDEIIEGILRNKQFVVLCKPPSELLPLPKGVENRNESSRIYPNIPRFENNERDLAPIQEGFDTTENGGTDICWYHANLAEFDGVTGHNDGRPLYRFKHRQPGKVAIYDHGAKVPKELICANCLENFIIDTATGGVKVDLEGNPLETNAEGNPVAVVRKPEDKLVQCFNVEKCKGHFHPSELRGIIRDEIYQAYREYYNRNPKLLGGSREEDKEDYPPLIGNPIVVEQDTCPVPFKGGKRRRVTRKAKKSKSKTRKSKRYSKTRKH